MSSVDRLFKLADRFARKISLGQGLPPPPAEQAMEAPDFFFGIGIERNLDKFTAALGELSVSGNQAVGNRSLALLMANFYNKANKVKDTNVSVTISVEVNPGAGAKWVTQIAPPEFTQTAMAELNKQYQAITGKSWIQGQADADRLAKAAKKVEGPGTKVIVDKAL